MQTQTIKGAAKDLLELSKDENENKSIVEPSTPQASKAQQHAQKLELAVLIEFMRGKRLKQLCKPFNLSTKAVEDTLRRGLGRRMVQGDSSAPPQGTKKVTIAKLDAPKLPAGIVPFPFEAPEVK